MRAATQPVATAPAPGRAPGRPGRARVPGRTHARDRPRATISYVAEDNIIALAARREAAFIIHPLLRTAAAATDSGSESEPEDDARRGLGVSA